MSLTAAIKAMVALGFTAEQIGAVVEKVDGERREKARAGNAKRQAEHRARHPKSNANNGVTDVTSNGDNGVTPRAHVVNTTSFPSVRKNLEDTPTASQCPQGGDEAKPKRARSNRGTRLPDDWRPSEELFSFGMGEGLSWAEVSAVGDEFRDYWRGVPGARGTKLDWPATFRNRLRDIARRKPKPSTRAGPRSTSGVVEMLNELNGVGNVEPDYERPAKDITPSAASEPGGCEPPTRLFESPRKPPGRETLDIRSTGPDLRGSSAPYVAAWRTG